MRRFGDEVLTARDCADWMGYSTEWIRRAIKTGVTAPDGTVVKLEAETVSLTGRRRVHRIYRDDFITFLIAIGWTRIPGEHATVVSPFPHATEA